MLCVADALDALEWMEAIGGLAATRARADANFAALQAWVDRTPLGREPGRRPGGALEHLGLPAGSSIRRSPARDEAAQRDFVKRMAKLLEAEGVAYDIAGYRDAPPGLRIWCGTTVDTADVEALTPWLDWAFAAAKAGLNPSLSDIRRAAARQRSHPMPKVLISDELSDAAVQIFRDRGVEVDFQPQLGKDPARLAEIIGGYDGLAIRSATKVTADLIARAGNLRVIGRAGIGVDNVDIPAASAKGIVVMNTPFGNSITTAEHAIAMMFACARQIPAADASTRAGKWEKSRFMGVEITGKTLGLIGCGNIGSVVAARAHRAEDEGDRLRPLPVGRARRGARGRADRGPRRAARAAPTSSPCTCRRPRRPRTSSRPSASRG